MYKIWFSARYKTYPENQQSVKAVVSEKTTFPRILCPLQSSSRKAKCACAARRGSGIMASWTRYGRRRREVEMYIFLCMVSNITLSVACRYFLQGLCGVSVHVLFYSWRLYGIGVWGCSWSWKVERALEAELETYNQSDRWIFHTVTAWLMRMDWSMDMFTACVGRSPLRPVCTRENRELIAATALQCRSNAAVYSVAAFFLRALRVVVSEK